MDFRATKGGASIRLDISMSLILLHKVSRLSIKELLLTLVVVFNTTVYPFNR